MAFRTREEVADQDERAMVQDRSWDISPGQIISLIVGILAIIMGLIAMIRAGLDTPLDQPVVDVMGFTHTAWLGIGEVALGVLLVLAGAMPHSGKPLSVVLGALMVIAGVLVVAETDSMPDQLALEKSYGWLLLITGAVVALAALLLPTISRTATRRAGDVRVRDRDIAQHA